jgi:hypothetical protein
LVLAGTAPAAAAEKPALEEALAREIIGPRQALLDLQDHLEPRIPRMPAVGSVAEWERHARQIRVGVLEKVVFRGEARAWRDAKVGVKWLDALPGGPGWRSTATTARARRRRTSKSAASTSPSAACWC